jgi:hypothetical protein
MCLNVWECMGMYADRTVRWRDLFLAMLLRFIMTECLLLQLFGYVVTGYRKY